MSETFKYIGIKIGTQVGTPIGLRSRVGGVTFVQEYQDVFNQFENEPSEADAAAQNDYVGAGVDDGWWSDLNGEFIHAHTASGADSLLNWISPTGTKAVLVNAPTFTLKEGYQGDGSTQHIDYGISPSGASKFLQNDAYFSLYTRDLGTSTSHVIMGVRGADCEINTDFFGSIAWDINGVADSYTTTGAAGMFEVEILSNAARIYLNNVQKDARNATPSTMSTFNFFGLATNNGGSAILRHDGQISNASIGAHLGATKRASKYNAFQALMTYYGKQV